MDAKIRADLDLEKVTGEKSNDLNKDQDKKVGDTEEVKVIESGAQEN